MKKLRDKSKLKKVNKENKGENERESSVKS